MGFGFLGSVLNAPLAIGKKSLDYGFDAAGLGDNGVSDLAQQNIDEFGNIKSPELQDLITKYISPEYAGDVKSQWSNYAADNDLRDSQAVALDRFMEIANADGLDAQAKARLEQMRSEEDQRERGSREAILQNAQMRGAGGSGLEFLNKINNAQSSADRRRLENTRILADSESRALNALAQGTGVAGDMRRQDFSEFSGKADALDAISRFNNSNRQQNYNAQAEAANKTSESRAGANQSVFNNQLDRTNAIAGARQGLIGAKNAQAERRLQFVRGAASAAATGGAA